MGEGMGFPGTDADTGATAARGCNALLMNTKNFIKDCLYIKLSTKLCPITPVAPFHAWKLLAAATVRHRLFHPPIPHHSLRHSWIVFNFSFVHVSIHDHSNSTSIETMPIEKCHGKTRDRRSIRLGRVNYFATFKTCMRISRTHVYTRISLDRCQALYT